MTSFLKTIAVVSCLRAACVAALSNFDSEIPDWCEDLTSCKSQIASAEHILLQKSQAREISKSSNFHSRASSDMETPSFKASEVPLNEEGYKAIAKLKNEREMAAFIKRVSNELGFEITEEAKLNGVVPYYNGKKATQSFSALTSEMSRTSKGLNGWAKKLDAKRRHAKPSSEFGQILLQSNQQTEESKVITNKTNSSTEHPMKAAEVPLDEDGYKTIANLKSEKEMMYFVKRTAEELGYEISDIGSLHGVVPYYSGKKATQSYLALEEELSRTSRQPKGWARKSQKQNKGDLIETRLHVSDEFLGNEEEKEEHASEKKLKNVKKEKEEHASEKKLENVNKEKAASKRRDVKDKVEQNHKFNKKETHKAIAKKLATNGKRHPSARNEDRDVVKSKQAAKKARSPPTARKETKSHALTAKGGETHKAHSKSKPKHSLSRKAPPELDETMRASHAGDKVNSKIMPQEKDLSTQSDKNTLHVFGKVRVQKGSNFNSIRVSAAPSS